MTEPLRYHLVNVFTRDGGALTGNPLCVFEDGTRLDGTAMQALARQFNLSETTFLLPSSRATARVRIFTPAFEMPFAGHPTLGSAHVVRRLRGVGDQVTLEMQAGVIPVAARGDVWTLDANPPRHREVDVPVEDLAAALSLRAGDIRHDASGSRPLWVNTGSDQLVVPLASREALDRLRPSVERLERLRSEQGRRLAYAFFDAGEGIVHARFLFEKGGSFQEDPATGSACANLGGWFLATGSTVPLVRVVLQGDAVQRPSTLYLSVDAGLRIHVGGHVAWIGGGEIDPASVGHG